MRVKSIRSRILWRLAPIFAGSCILAAGFVYFGTRAELRDALDAQSDILALTIAGLAGETIPLTSFDDGFKRYADDYLIQVWDEDGSLLVDSRSALTGLTQPEVTQEAPTILGPEWDTREYALASGERVLIARLKQEADELVLQVALTSMVPLALALLGSILTAAFLIRQGLNPLTSMSKELTRRSASDLRLLPDDDAPDELRPIIDEMNSLFGRIEAALRRERRFVDDAAHEFRTPLSVIKAQCQAIDVDQLDAETRQRLDNVAKGVDRMAALSSQLLDQALSEQEAARMRMVPLAQLIEAVITELRPEAERRDTTIQLVKDATLQSTAVPDDLRVIFRNLLENAIKYSGRPGRVVLTLTDRFATFEDNGSGILEDQRTKVFDRFYQVDKAAGGAGLGLSIVRALAQRNGLHVVAQQSPRLSGACFRVEWPDPSTTTGAT